jgi:lipopolysaccharide transport system ATP-binding protein
MRLAFSVAAHLDPEVLIIDEVLAVGDADFQQKCLGKMQDISQSGRTVIFVSHSMQTVTSLCDRCLLLENGQIKSDGLPSSVVVEYLGGTGSRSRADFTGLARPVGDEYVQLLYGEVVDMDGLPILEIDIRKSAMVRMCFRVMKVSEIKYMPNFHFIVPGGIYAFVSTPTTISELRPGDYVAECTLPGDFLNEGAYFVGLAISSFSPGLAVHFYEQSALTFNVRDSMQGSVGRHGYANIIPGVLRPRLSWTVERKL